MATNKCYRCHVWIRYRGSRHIVSNIYFSGVNSTEKALLQDGYAVRKALLQIMSRDRVKQFVDSSGNFISGSIATEKPKITKLVVLEYVGDVPIGL